LVYKIVCLYNNEILLVTVNIASKVLHRMSLGIKFSLMLIEASTCIFVFTSGKLFLYTLNRSYTYCVVNIDESDMGAAPVYGV
jgi:hypothetical protein